jgi:hypothetical protein
MGGNSLCVIVHHEITERSSQRGTLSSYYQPVTGMHFLFFLFPLVVVGALYYIIYELWDNTLCIVSNFDNK